jgi:hypothetical protein
MHSFVWLASFPRSGNTLLRTILWNCFGLRSASVYPNDLGNNRVLEQTVGHIEQHNGQISFPDNQRVSLLKTHEHAHDTLPAIYVVRDGRSAICSLWDFYNRKISLKVLIEGHHQFGVWQDHLESWNYRERPDTLFLRFETLTSDFRETLAKISSFLEQEIISNKLPPRKAIASADGRWVRDGSIRDENPLEGELLERFHAINATGLSRAGYT